VQEIALHEVNKAYTKYKGERSKRW
jgi:hypothetical protein